MTDRTPPFDLLNSPLRPGITLIEASAGTGKTYCLTGLILRLVVEGQVEDLGRILAVTFTNAATEELVTRVRNRLREAAHVCSGRLEVDPRKDPLLAGLKTRHAQDAGPRLERCLAHLDELNICTIHGFCQRVLRNAAFESGTPFQAELIQDDRPLIEQAAADFWRSHLYLDDPLAALAVSEKWTLDTLIGYYLDYNRFQNTAFLPDTKPFPDARASLDQAKAALTRSFDSQRLKDLLAGLTWNKDAPLEGTQLDRYLEQVQKFTTGQSMVDLSILSAFTNAQIAKYLNKQKKEGKNPPRDPFFDACEAWASAVHEFDLAFRHAFILEVRKTFTQEKQRRHLLTYDDLLEQVHAALMDEKVGPLLGERIRGQYDVALIDEFQDTDSIQYEIFRTAFEGQPLFFIGDPKQSIYSFRGADIFAYLKASGSSDNKFTLDRNFRSHPQLIKGVNALFSDVQTPFVFNEIAFQPVQAREGEDLESLSGDSARPLQWWFVPPESDAKGLPTAYRKDAGRQIIFQHVANEIIQLLDGKHAIGGKALLPNQIAILVRSNRQAQELQDLLRDAGVPSVIGQTGDILESREMMEMEHLLRAIAEPRRLSAVRVALASDLWGHQASDIYSLQDNDDRLQEEIDKFKHFRELWVTKGFVPMIQHLISDKRIRDRLLAFQDGERRLTNLLHSVEYLHEGDLEHPFSPEGLLHWLAHTRTDPNRDQERTELRLESDEKSVQICTIHKSKGLEYEIVFCPTLWDPILVPSDKPVLAHLSNDAVVYDHGSDRLEEHFRKAETERLAEDLRLTYVAVTRAKQRCYIAWGPIGDMRKNMESGAFRSALGYLLYAEGGQDAASPEDRAARAVDSIPSDLSTWQGHLEDRIAAHTEYMALRVLEKKPLRLRWTRQESDQRPLSARVWDRHRDDQCRSWQISSFSSLTRNQTREVPDHADPDSPSEPAQDTPRGIFAFARGERAGSCLHEIMEHCDFTAVGNDQTTALVSQKLQKFSLDRKIPGEQENPVSLIKSMLADVCGSPLPGASFSLSQIDNAHRLNEWQFFLPVGKLTPAHLQGIFAGRQASPLQQRYAATLGGMSRQELHGYLTGFVDLLVEHAGRWYVLDWKSNHLGNTIACYNQSAMEQAMIYHHYVLQYHLYLVALQRYLRSRLLDYSYDRYVGGAWYAFLRGIEADGEQGWFHDRPSAELIQELDEALT